MKKDPAARARPDRMPAVGLASPKEKPPPPLRIRDKHELLRDLRKHRTELETQNEEPRRKQMELEKSRRRDAELYDFAPLGYFTLDREGRIIAVNITGAQWLGVDRLHLRKAPFISFVLPEDRGPFCAHQHKVMAAGARQTCRLRLRRRDGATFSASLQTVRVLDEEGNITQLRTVVSDLTERERAEEELRRAHDELEAKVRKRTAELLRANEELRAEIAERLQLEEKLEKGREELETRVKERTEQLRHLSARLLSAQEQERRRIAREVHDSLGQSLAALKFRVENLRERLPGPENHFARESLEALLPLVQASMEEARRIQSDLRPTILDDLGILATLAWFSREFGRTYPHIHVERAIQIEETDVPENLKTVIYRIVQEAMNNIGKHSQADSAGLFLRQAEGRIELVIRDNGRGFDPEKIARGAETRRGLGLTSMGERVELSGGQFRVAALPGKGTAIVASWPARDSAAD